MLNITFLGDIVGRPGRNAVKNYLVDINPDLIIANAENSAGGNGLTAKLAHELKGYGCDYLTLGDHVWDQKNFENEIDSLEFVCETIQLANQQSRQTLSYFFQKTKLRLQSQHFWDEVLWA